MATAGRVPSLGFGASIGAVVLLGFGGIASSITSGGVAAHARAYATNSRSAVAYETTIAVTSALVSNVVAARAYADTPTNVVRARAYATNLVSVRALMELP